MATISAVANSNGTVTITVSGAAAGANYLVIQNTTVGPGSLFAGAYSSGPVTITDTLAKALTADNYVATFHSGGSSGGPVVGTISASAIPGWTPPAPSVTFSGQNSGCSWSAMSNGNARYTETSVDLSYRINSGGWVTYATGLAAGSGSVPSSSVFVGYGNTIEWDVAHRLHSATYSQDTTGVRTASATVPPAPPAAPGPPTGLTAVDSGTSVGLSWTAPVGGATGYEISRGVTVIGTQSGTSKTDSSPGATRPLTYSVRAYNSNSSGTAYSSSVSILVGSSDSVGLLIG